ncbi:hypothetical protein EZS27_038063, partial [termite gut metagenome]
MRMNFRKSFYVSGIFILVTVLSFLSGCGLNNQTTLSNAAGVKYQLQKSDKGWGLGTLSLNGKPIESPFNDGVLFLRKNDGSVYRPVPANEAKRIDDLTAELTGKTEVDGVVLTFKLKVTLDNNKTVVYLPPSW